VRAWIGLAVLTLPTILLALDLTVLYMALPHLGSDLGASNTQLLWITDIYGFMVAGLLITMGTLGDRIGRRRLLLTGAVAFGAASVLAAYSTSPEMLIGTRALLGIAGATLMPSTLSLLGTMFQDPKQRSLAIGIWLMSFAGGGAIGPAVGGIMLEHFWWVRCSSSASPSCCSCSPPAPCCCRSTATPPQDGSTWPASCCP
jgi:DHA2 family multidrug resistance protein-like MFS transporter